METAMLPAVVVPEPSVTVPVPLLELLKAAKTFAFWSTCRVTFCPGVIVSEVGVPELVTNVPEVTLSVME